MSEAPSEKTIEYIESLAARLAKLKGEEVEYDVPIIQEDADPIIKDLKIRIAAARVKPSRNYHSNRLERAADPTLERLRNLWHQLGDDGERKATLDGIALNVKRRAKKGHENLLSGNEEEFVTANERRTQSSSDQ